MRISGVQFNLDKSNDRNSVQAAPNSTSNMTPLGSMMVVQNSEEEEYDDDSFDSYQQSKSARNSLDHMPVSRKNSDVGSQKTDKEERKVRCILM